MEQPLSRMNKHSTRDKLYLLIKKFKRNYIGEKEEKEEDVGSDKSLRDIAIQDSYKIWKGQNAAMKLKTGIGWIASSTTMFQFHWNIRSNKSLEKQRKSRPRI